MSFKSCTIIGYGRVGKAFERVLTDKGIDEIQILHKGDELLIRGELLIIATPDNQIAKVVELISEQKPDLTDALAVHCSGTVSSSILKPLEQLNAEIACFHPIQSVTTDTNSFDGSVFDVEGESSAINKLTELAELLGAKVLRVSSEQKEKLHISAVIASNYLVTLADMAADISAESGLEKSQVLKALVPLMESSVQNLSNQNPTEALTGPIARGDIETVKRHIELLQGSPEHLNIYKTLGALTVKIADLTDSEKAKLLNILQ